MPKAQDKESFSFMKFQIKDIKSRPVADGLVLTYFAKEKLDAHVWWKYLRAADKKQVQRLLKTKEFSGKINEVKIILCQPKGKIILFGLGEKNKWTNRKLILAIRKIVVTAKAEKVATIALAPDFFVTSKKSITRDAQTIAENAVMANYEFTKYKQDQKNNFAIKFVSLFVSKENLVLVKQGVQVGTVVGEQINDSRDLGNIPGGEMTPTLLATKAQIAGKEHGFTVKVLGRAEMKKLNMGAILGVAHGSAEEPKFIVMEYWGGNKKDRPVVLVGKGVTFDTGGLNLKPTGAMSDMHLDMIGGAAVIAAVGAVAKLKLPVNVVGLVPTVENMPGSAGFRPGDVLHSMSGKTIEVVNTDAEGRVILADALTYAERYQPKLIVDIATLTGACAVALGTHCSGLMTPDTELQNKLQQAGEISGDYLWPLPMWEEYEASIKGTFGDIQNDDRTRNAGAILGGMFLWQFAKKYPWAHLDIAGPMKSTESECLAKGANGVGVRVLVEIVRNYK